MPNYDVLCNKCDIEFEEYAKVEDKDDIKCHTCGSVTQTLITQRGFQFLDGYDPNLQAFVTGPKHRDKIMKEKGLEEVHKSEVTRINNDVIPPSKEEIGHKKMAKTVDSLHKKGKFNPKWSKYVNV